MSQKLPTRSPTAPLPTPPTAPAPAGDDGGLPEGWEMAKVAELIESFQPGFASGEKNVEGGVKHLRMNNIGVTGDLFLELVRTVPEKLASQRHELHDGDVLVCTTNSGKLVGKCALFNLTGRYMFSNHLTRLRPLFESVDGSFLRWAIWLHWQRGLFESYCKHWVNQSTIPKEVLLDVELPLPPLAEQRRIVGKLEEVLGKVAECQGRLARVPGLLKRFRQSILAAACSGKLTADWRDGNEPSPYDDKLITDPNDDPERPWNWGTTLLGPLIELVTSGSRGWAKYYSDSGSTFIRAQNINSDLLDLEDIAFVRLPNKAEGLRTRVNQHDILITITGANVTKSALVELEIDDAYVSQHVALVRLKDERLAKFLFHWILSVAHGRKQLQASAYGQGKPGLNLDNIRDVEVHVPPLAEQHEIVRRVEQLFALADRIEAQLDAARTRVDKLTQSVLAKAFRGELVPTEADLARRAGRSYEPASELLARIRSQTPATTTRKPRKKKDEA